MLTGFFKKLNLCSRFQPIVPILLFALAVAIRLPGTYRGLPYLDMNSWDEPFIMNPAIDALRSGNWDPGWQMYPGGPIHLQTLVAGYTVLSLASQGRMYYPSQMKTATDTKYFWTVSVPEIYWNGRRFLVVLGALLVVVVYQITRYVLGFLPAVATALLVGISPELVSLSAIIRPDTYAAFMVSLCC